MNLGELKFFVSNDFTEPTFSVIKYYSARQFNDVTKFDPDDYFTVN